jgi:ubiquinone biosynthesis protein
LRQTFANIGGTFIKFGQQMAIRVDLLPYAYCEELTKLLDRVEPFPSAQAITAVERVTGKPLAETFRTFDPAPIGSASVACVYQAILLNGDKVAVKVRRPHIGELFEADFWYWAGYSKPWNC